MDGLVQERRNSDYALELRLSCTHASICYHFYVHFTFRPNALQIQRGEYNPFLVI